MKTHVEPLALKVRWLRRQKPCLSPSSLLLITSKCLQKNVYSQKRMLTLMKTALFLENMVSGFQGKPLGKSVILRFSSQRTFFSVSLFYILVKMIIDVQCRMFCRKQRKITNELRRGIQLCIICFQVPGSQKEFIGKIVPTEAGDGLRQQQISTVSHFCFWTPDGQDSPLRCQIGKTATTRIGLWVAMLTLSLTTVCFGKIM